MKVKKSKLSVCVGDGNSIFWKRLEKRGLMRSLVCCNKSEWRIDERAKMEREREIEKGRERGDILIFHHLAQN